MALHPYSTGGPRRVQIIPVLAAASVGLWALMRLLRTPIYQILKPLNIGIVAHVSPLICFAVVYWLFDNYGWRLYVLSQTPNLNGTWTGVVETPYKRVQKQEAVVHIRQTWSHMEIHLETAISQSWSNMAFLSAYDHREAGLRYEYLAKPKEPLSTSICIQDHRTPRRVRAPKNRSISALRGTYFTDGNQDGDQHKGKVQLKLVSRRRLRFADLFPSTEESNGNGAMPEHFGVSHMDLCS